MLKEPNLKPFWGNEHIKCHQDIAHMTHLNLIYLPSTFYIKKNQHQNAIPQMIHKLKISYHVGFRKIKSKLVSHILLNIM